MPDIFPSTLHALSHLILIQPCNITTPVYKINWEFGEVMQIAQSHLYSKGKRVRTGNRWEPKAHALSVSLDAPAPDTAPMLPENEVEL